MPVVNGWFLFWHPLFRAQFERLTAAVDEERTKKPSEYQRGAKAKLLAALRKLLFETIPANPTNPAYRQGDTLGAEYKHWFRAKLGNQRFRLFFRYHSNAKIIVYVWINDDETRRTYGSKQDAYAVFRKMLESGNPPNDWHGLVKASVEEEATARLEAAMKGE